MSFMAVTTRAVAEKHGPRVASVPFRPGGAMSKQHRLPVSDVSEALQRLLSWYEIPSG